MFVSDCLAVNEKNHLTIGGVDATEIAQQYGTPLYVMDEEQIRKSCRAFTSSMRRNYGGRGLVLFASKAFCCKEMCRICESEDMGLDVVSGGELYTAKSAGFPMEKICFHGNNKSPLELQMAVESGVGRIIVDNLDELQRLEAIAAASGKSAAVLLRIKPGIDAHTHDFIRTGQIDSKFGFALETGEAEEAVRCALALEHVVLKGFHCHIASQVFDIMPFNEAVQVMLDFASHIRSETGFTMEELNLGGGFGVRYKATDNPPALEQYMDTVGAYLHEYCEKIGFPVPFIYIEPGRSIVANAGITLYTVGTVKTIPDVRTYVSIDGGMFDNPRYILYQSDYDVVCVNRAGDPRDTVVTIAGKCCESGDLIQEHTPLQPVQTGDLVAVLCTGAYNYSMASNYNRNCRPPVVFVSGGETRLVIRGETFEDLVRCDL